MFSFSFVKWNTFVNISICKTSDLSHIAFTIFPKFCNVKRPAHMEMDNKLLEWNLQKLLDDNNFR